MTHPMAVTSLATAGGERRDRIAAGVDIHHHAAIAGDGDRMPGAERPAITTGRVGAGRRQRPVADAGVRLDRVAAAMAFIAR